MRATIKSMIMLAATGLSAANPAPSSTAHIRIGATISHFLAISTDSLLHISESRPGSRIRQAWTDLKLNAAAAGCTVHVPPSLMLQAPGGPSFAVAVEVMQASAAKRLETKLEMPGGMQGGAYSGVMDVVVVYN